MIAHAAKTSQKTPNGPSGGGEDDEDVDNPFADMLRRSTRARGSSSSASVQSRDDLAGSSSARELGSGGSIGGSHAQLAEVHSSAVPPTVPAGQNAADAATVPAVSNGIAEADEKEPQQQQQQPQQQLRDVETARNEDAKPGLALNVSCERDEKSRSCHAGESAHANPSSAWAFAPATAAVGTTGVESPAREQAGSGDSSAASTPRRQGRSSRRVLHVGASQRRALLRCRAAERRLNGDSGDGVAGGGDVLERSQTLDYSRLRPRSDMRDSLDSFAGEAYAASVGILEEGIFDSFEDLRSEDGGESVGRGGGGGSGSGRWLPPYFRTAEKQQQQQHQQQGEQVEQDEREEREQQQRRRRSLSWKEKTDNGDELTDYPRSGSYGESVCESDVQSVDDGEFSIDGDNESLGGERKTRVRFRRITNSRSLKALSGRDAESDCNGDAAGGGGSGPRSAATATSPSDAQYAHFTAALPPLCASPLRTYSSRRRTMELALISPTAVANRRNNSASSPSASPYHARSAGLSPSSANASAGFGNGSASGISPPAGSASVAPSGPAAAAGATAASGERRAARQWTGPRAASPDVPPPGGVVVVRERSFTRSLTLGSNPSASQHSQQRQQQRDVRRSYGGSFKDRVGALEGDGEMMGGGGWGASREPTPVHSSSSSRNQGGMNAGNVETGGETVGNGGGLVVAPQCAVCCGARGGASGAGRAGGSGRRGSCSGCDCCSGAVSGADAGEGSEGPGRGSRGAGGAGGGGSRGSSGGGSRWGSPQDWASAAAAVAGGAPGAAGGAGGAGGTAGAAGGAMGMGGGAPKVMVSILPSFAQHRAMVAQAEQQEKALLLGDLAGKLGRRRRGGAGGGGGARVLVVTHADGDGEEGSETEPLGKTGSEGSFVDERGGEGDGVEGGERGDNGQMCSEQVGHAGQENQMEQEGHVDCVRQGAGEGAAEGVADAPAGQSVDGRFQSVASSTFSESPLSDGRETLGGDASSGDGGDSAISGDVDYSAISAGGVEAHEQKQQQQQQPPPLDGFAGTGKAQQQQQLWEDPVCIAPMYSVRIRSRPESS
ncbi:unnamed protein product [Closterium sp. NIES-64]|nr:unnamed protein product [Closterium sp. NIES-64]